MSWYGWRPYVPVAVRRARALTKMEKLRKKGMQIQPVKIEGRKIARSFWGQAWCDHLEKFSDYENRLPRGRTYVRNGSVCHLEITEGIVNAIVSGSDLYNVNIEIKRLSQKKWAQVKKRCGGQIGSLLELLEGKLSKSVMTVVTDRDNGLFPHPGEINLRCTCPDWAVMCKHVAAVLYAVGARLDVEPELLFLLRGVDQEELISAEAGMAAVSGLSGTDGHRRIAENELSHLFGIEMRGEEARAMVKPPSKGLPKTGRGTRHGAKATGAKQPTVSSSKRRKSRALPKKAAPVTAATEPATGKGVAKLRKKFNMSQVQFARLFGVSQATISNWENSKGKLNFQEDTRKTWNRLNSGDIILNS